MIKILLGGSPCTYWSIAQKNNRETVASGLGWELFCNYLVAKEKFKPDFFLYENNKSASQVIKDQIKQELGVGSDAQARFTYINSALVSAQNRQRFYVTNFGDIEQPEDRGIFLKDILETDKDLSQMDITPLAPFVEDKLPQITSKYGYLPKMFNPYNLAEITEKAPTLTTGAGSQTKSSTVMVVEPIKHGNPRYLLKNLKTGEEKANTLTASFYKGIGSDGMITVPEPVCMRYERSEKAKKLRKQYEAGEIHPRTDGKTNTLSTVLKDNPICEPVRDGQITIREKQYPIKLIDGYYIIRKLTVTECCRLQTMPDDYCKAVSATQGYKGLGNGWTAEVIIHLLNHALKDVPRNEELVVLSLYDGIGTGRYCLDKMGFTNIKYYAYEIDEFAMKVANSNYPDIIQCGDAYKVLADDWMLQC